ncbi:hypothetical protein Kpol_1003p13 [Vanderwaltozyma polyspora DSM 70294]|uniref:peptide chain release factor N(5)-glutamine methyltransferase n=1 Tax=Vanderwaltozyma polyspora (strain ATCC 22028 / DSM 70294 / BCRC 21397 / CBS 2163 / NBRC 10782 / NRRL Y-8283 / UCD 57-17) TaxID=436907 RepID=A7TLX1_VANPO|nr:uncharacterized protein Kpol_1003p13 [Vanderwaltozyma polyspora DSM 70294]EDO16708.1 hypothetical protein Kpol_1003p13 [Vanderwaltozyma polyspora DSM 70294]
MPRISTKTIHEAYKINPFLPLLLPECRTISQAKLELKWINQEFAKTAPDHYTLQKNIKKACIQRFHHIPLQYILKSQPFGSLNIKCQPCVLIPRWETEEWVMDLIQSIKNGKQSLESKNQISIVDLCTGSGCIALLLKRELSKILNSNLNVKAVDCSDSAIDLVNRNKLESSEDPIDIEVLKFDILQSNNIDSILSNQKIDILTCNPPYIPKSDFQRDVTKSVKLFEPKLALIGDKEFYSNLLEKWIPHINSFVYEVGNIDQVKFVKDYISNDNTLNKIWTVGSKYDSNKQCRVVYGYVNSPNSSSYDISKIFSNFGTVIHPSK